MLFYPLFSGSSGNCSVVESKNTRIMVDAGCTGKAICEALAHCSLTPDSVDAIVVTHEHSDHIKSIAMLSKRYGIPVYANEGTWRGINDYLARQSGSRIPDKMMRVFETGRDFFIGEIAVCPFPIPHDASEPVGYTFFSNGRKLSVATDIGHVTEGICSALSGSDLLLIEANHDVDMLKSGPYPYLLKKRVLGENGHLSNESCGKLLARLYTQGVTRAILGHLSGENNTEAVAVRSVRQVLLDEDIGEQVFSLNIAHRDRVCGIFEV